MAVYNNGYSVAVASTVSSVNIDPTQIANTHISILRSIPFSVSTFVVKIKRYLLII